MRTCISWLLLATLIVPLLPGVGYDDACQDGCAVKGKSCCCPTKNSTASAHSHTSREKSEPAHCEPKANCRMGADPGPFLLDDSERLALLPESKRLTFDWPSRKAVHHPLFYHSSVIVDPTPPPRLNG